LVTIFNSVPQSPLQFIQIGWQARERFSSAWHGNLALFSLSLGYLREYLAQNP
jgi:hypothetical protein